MARIRSLGLALVFALGFGGCAMSGPQEDLGSSSEAARGRACTSSDSCPSGSYCSVEDGDCFSNCRRGSACPAVCWGVCKRDDRATCGTATCGAGQVCCNASCGICTDPGGFCTQQVCGSTTPL